MAALDDAVSTLKGLVTNVSQIWAVMKAIFPQQTGTSTTATGGAATLPGNPVGFINVTLPSGTAVKLPYYNP